MNPPDLEGPTDGEPGCTAVTEDPQLSLSVRRQQRSLGCRRVCGNKCGTSLPYAVCVSLHESHLSEALTCVLQSLCGSRFPNIIHLISTVHKWPLQLQSHLQSTQAENTGHSCLPETMSSMEEMLCCAQIPSSPQARLGSASRDKVFC